MGHGSKRSEHFWIMNLYTIKIDNQYLAGQLYKSIYLSFDQTNAEVISGEKELQEYVSFIINLKTQGRLTFKELNIIEG